MVKMMKMGVGALAFAAIDAFGAEASEPEEQVKVRYLHTSFVTRDLIVCPFLAQIICNISFALVQITFLMSI